MIFDILFISCVVSLALLIWFHSEAFVEYAKLVGGAKFFGVTEYEEQRKKTAALDYLGYLLENKNSFFNRLITCPLCLSVWLSLIVTFLVTDSLLLFPVCEIISLALYKGLANLLES